MNKIENNNNRKNPNKYAMKNMESLYGIILIFLGLSFINNNVFFNLLWQVGVIIWGALNIKEENYLVGTILILFGSLFIIDMITKNDLTGYLTGLFFIVVGGKIIFDNLRH